MLYTLEQLSETTRKNLTDLKGILEAYIASSQGDAFAICYGSTVRNNAHSSDLDMLIVEKHPSNCATKKEFIKKLIALHEKQDRIMDLEVPYENKLFYSIDEAHEALSLSMLHSDCGNLQIELLRDKKDDDPYFSSQSMKYRLFFNALTSSHVFLAGNKKLHTDMLNMAQESFEKLAPELCALNCVSAARKKELLSVLCSFKDNHYKDFLGYTQDDQYFLKQVSSLTKKM